MAGITNNPNKDPSPIPLNPAPENDGSSWNSLLDWTVFSSTRNGHHKGQPFCVQLKRAENAFDLKNRNKKMRNIITKQKSRKRKTTGKNRKSDRKQPFNFKNKFHKTLVGGFVVKWSVTSPPCF